MAKNKIIVVCLLLFVSGMAVSFQKPTIKDVYTSQIGHVEIPKGSNWGPQVQPYLKSVKVKTPAPWCAAFVRWCLDSAGIKSTITAYSPSAHNSRNIVYYRIKLYKPIEPGDVFTIYFAAMGRIAHTGFVDHQINDAIVETVEGNSNDGGSREGYGVFRRKRSKHTLHSITRWN